MAGDWIKVEHSTLDKPEVLRTAEMLGLTRDAALGLFLRYFVWLDRNLSGSCPDSVRSLSGSCPDVVRNVSAKSLDEVLMCPGFSACLQAIRWADFDEKHWTLRVVNADRHNGTTAKSRALDSRRKSGQRRENVRDLSGSKPDKSRTREEKRRVLKETTGGLSTKREKKPSTAPDDEGFVRFWTEWPTHKRKAARKDCLSRWRSAKLEARADEIVQHVRTMKASADWLKEGGEFIPAPAVYLGQERFDAPAGKAAVSKALPF